MSKETDKTTDRMLYFDGSEKSYRCECECNVFRYAGHDDESIEYRCNACKRPVYAKNERQSLRTREHFSISHLN